MFRIDPYVRQGAWHSTCDSLGSTVGVFMYAKPTLSIAAALFVAGCGAPIAEGQIAICSTEQPQIEEAGVVFSGVVAALNDGSVDCSESVTITGEDDSVITVGYTLLDADGVDITPELDLAVNDSVSGLYRRLARM